MLSLNSQNNTDADTLIENVATKFKPIFAKGNYTADQKRAIYRYFFSQKPKKLPPSLKSRTLNLYDPLADRTKRFPDGLRFCLNVYTGCAHSCGYCYVNGYSKEGVGFSPHVKAGFKEKLAKDLNDIKNLQLPKAPLHLSNSTDICQHDLETEHRHSLFALQKINENRNLFGPIAILTKNPAILCDKAYLLILKNETIRPLAVQITCAFWRDEARKYYEPNAPTVQSRLEAFKTLCENGITTELRLDPLFPCNEIDPVLRRHHPLNSYGLPEPQTDNDLAELARFVKNANGKTVISKPLKIPISDKAQQSKDWFVKLYRDANPTGQSIVKGGSYRLPDAYQKAIMTRAKKICEKQGLAFKYCKHDALTRK